MEHLLPIDHAKPERRFTMTTFKTLCIAGITALILPLGAATPASAQEALVRFESESEVINQDTPGCTAQSTITNDCYKLPKPHRLGVVAAAFGEKLLNGYTVARLISSNSDNPIWKNATADTVLESGTFFRVR